MKTTIALLMAMLFFVPLTVVAQEQTEVGDELIAGDGGIGPDNPFYGFDVAFDNIAMALTWDPEAKAKLCLKVAEERLLEAKTMAERGKPEFVKAAQEQYRAMVEAAIQAAESIPEDSSNVTARIKERATIRIQNEAENLTLKVALVIDRVSTKVLNQTPESARPALEQAFARIQEHIQNMTQRMIAKREEIKLRLRAMENKTEVEIENESKTAEIEEGLAAARIERAEKIAQRIEARFEKLEQKIENLNISEEAKVRITEKIESVKQKIKNISEISEMINATQAANAFGQQISELAQQIRTGEITAQQLVATATSHSESVLAQIRSRTEAQIQNQATIRNITIKPVLNQTRERERTGG